MGPGGGVSRVRRIGQIGGFDPTFVQGAADNIIKEEFFDFPDALFFHIFIFPDAAANQSTEFATSWHGAKEEAIPPAFGSFTIRVYVDDTCN